MMTWKLLYPLWFIAKCLLCLCAAGAIATHVRETTENPSLANGVGGVAVVILLAVFVF